MSLTKQIKLNIINKQLNDNSIYTEYLTEYNRYHLT